MRAFLHVDLVELAREAARPGNQVFLTEEQVGYNVEVVAEREVLVDGCDAERGGVAGSGDLDLLALEEHAPFVGQLDAGDRLDQGGLAGAVVADDRHDLTCVQVEVDVLERLNLAEALADALGLQKRRIAVAGHDGSFAAPEDPRIRPNPGTWSVEGRSRR